MKFSTVRKVGDAYQVIAGATFPLIPVGVGTPAHMAVSAVSLNEHTVRAGGSVEISNDLLLSNDVQIHTHRNTDRKLLTILKAAARLGDTALMVLESEAVRCEKQHQAHAIWIPDTLSWHGGSYSSELQLLKLSPGESKMTARQILMPGLAVLTEDDVLEAKLVQYAPAPVVHSWGTPPKYPPTETCIESFTITFDGTNIKLDGVKVSQTPQECYV